MKRKAAARDEAPGGDDAPDEAFDEEEATRQAKRMKSEELRAALEAAGVEDTDGNKPALVERLVAAKKRAAAGDNDDGEAAPAAFDEEDATRLAKRMKVEELRAALEAAGVEDAEGTKPVLVERLVAAQRAAAAPQAEAPAPAEAFDAAAATSAAKRMKVEELRAALEAAGASTEGNKPTLVERLVAAQCGDATDEDAEAAPEPSKEAAEAQQEEPQQVTPEETPAEAPAPAPKPQEEDSDDDFAPKKNPWDEENPTPEATGEVLDPYILLKRDFPGRDDDLRQLGVEPTIARENKPFKLKKKPMSATTPEHVTMVPRTDGSSSLLNAPWVANRALGHGAFGAVFDVTLKGKDAQRCALKICFNGGRERRFGIEREIEVLAEVSRRRPAKPAPAPAPAAEAPAPAPDPTSLPPLTEDARSLIERAAPLEIQTENPKKGASAARFDAYKGSTTAKEFVEKGGTKADLKYDIGRGYARVLDRGPPLIHAQARSIRPAQAPPVDGPQSVGGLADLKAFFGYRDASAVAMRLADTTLSELAKALNAQKMRFTEPVALFYAIGVLEACQEMHLADFIHADIKPDNLCVSYGDLTRVGAGPSVDAIAAAGYNVTLIDYSISVDLRSFDKDQRFLGSEGSPCQVKEYSWPPALKGASWRREVDLYGLGCILYQMVVSAIQPKGIDMTVTTLEKRIPRGWNKLLWAHILDQLLNARESADLGEMARDLRRNLEDDVLQGDTLRLVELLDHHRRLTPRDERGVANGGGAPSPPKPRVPKPRAPREKREPFFRPPLPMREKLIKWKLSGCTVAVTPITVIDTREHIVRALDFPDSILTPAPPAPAPAAEAPAPAPAAPADAPAPAPA